MNYIDIILAAILLWAAYRGFSKGFIIHAASLAALLLGIFGAIRFSDVTARLLIQKFDFTSQYLPVISFAITFVVIVVAVHLFARLLDKLVKAVALGFVNRIAGVLFALIKTAFIISIILVILNTIDRRLSFLPHQQIEKSYLYKPLSNLAPALFPYLHFDYIFEPDKENPSTEIIALEEQRSILSRE